jgi:N-acetylglucosaminyldiphosphoundecaprenol N-acetyl-beta-D-mannosaminyltransferase
VDPLSLSAVKTFIKQYAPRKEQLVLSTININWVVRSFTDADFRSAILQSDLVTLDGKPLQWLAKLIGYPIKETVPGSTLIQELYDEPSDRPLTIFLFGGEGNAAKTAMENINRRSGGLKAVGAMNPGYGTAAEMSSPAIIDTINRASPDILLVALGAVKGAAWIQNNRHRLNAGVISHLGATVNFLAGTVQRAPRFMQSLGLEWLWRIYKEPNLFSRYLGDGLELSRYLLSRLPLWVRYRSRRRQYCSMDWDRAGQWQENKEQITITLGRCLRAAPSSPLREQLLRAMRTGKDIMIDLKATEYVDGTFLGFLLMLQTHIQNGGQRLEFTHVHARIRKTLSLFYAHETQTGVTIEP